MKEDGFKIFLNSYLNLLLKNELETIMECLENYLIKINNNLNNLNEDNDDNIKQLDFVGSIGRLFEYVAMLIEDKQNFIIKNFGNEKFVEIIDYLQSQCDIYSCSILEKFLKEIKIENIVSY